MQALANQVCEKVESKQRTTYNEVADELVSEFGNVEGTGKNLTLLLSSNSACIAVLLSTALVPSSVAMWCPNYKCKPGSTDVTLILKCLPPMAAIVVSNQGSCLTEC